MRNKKAPVNRRKLHKRTGAKLRTKWPHAKVLENIGKLIHEFEIHQVELKLNQELNQSQVELALLRDRYTHLYESSPLAYVTLDHDGRIVEGNLMAAQLLGVEREGLLGTNLAKFITIESQPDWYQYRRAALSNVVKLACEVRMRRTDNTLLSIRAESMDSGCGLDGRCRMALVDISQQILAEAEREHLMFRELIAREELEAASKLQDRLLSTVSHELRTPLTPILGWSKLLRDKTVNDAFLDRGLESIERNARLQKQLIDNLLDLSDGIEGRVRCHFCPVELPTIIDAAVERSAADAKAIQIDKEVDEDARWVFGDPDRLQQMIGNLLSNAVKFTPHGGRIEAKLKALSASHIQIVVSDTGIGIPEDFLPYVFVPFSQADNASTGEHRGLGLGLAIVRQIVKMHGGTAQVSSEEGKGTSFTIELPIGNVIARKQASADSFSAPDLSRLPEAA